MKWLGNLSGDWLRVLLSRCGGVCRTQQLDEDLDEELQAHLDLAIEENRRQGMGKTEARTAALVKFGGVTQTKETYRLGRGFPWIATVLQDVRFAQRQFVRSPGFAFVAIMTLALGIGANTAVFTLTHALLLSSLPVSQPDRLVRLAIRMNIPDEDAGDIPLSLPMIQAIEKRSHVFSGVFGWSVYDFVLKEGDRMHGIHGAVVTGNAFPTLGVTAAAGRLLLPADDQPGGPLNGVISYRYWQAQYHGDPEIVGKQITVTDRPVTIVGVAPRGFEGVLVAEHPDLYLPTEFEHRIYPEIRKQPGGRLWLTTLARLKPGISREQAAAEMEAMYPGICAEVLPPAILRLAEVQKSRLQVLPGRTGWTQLRRQYTRPLKLLQLLVVGVLAVCCVNLSGLLLARASARQQEFAIRHALGAGQFRVARQVFIESMMLAVPGALLGIALACMAGPWILHSLGSRQAELSLSPRPDLAVLAVTALCTLLCTITFGMAPAWAASHMRAATVSYGQRARTTLGRVGARRLFIPLQIALSLTLVVVAALLGATVMRLRTEDSGYRVDNVIFVITDFNRIPQKGTELIALYRRMVARMEDLPGVDAASVSQIPALMSWGDSDKFVAAESTQHAQPAEVDDNSIAAHYFAAVGTPLIAGRDLRNDDADLNSCLVNKAAANLFFSTGTPLGKTLRQIQNDFDTGMSVARDCRVIGVVQNSKYDSLHESPPPIVYLPISKDTGRLAGLFFVIHAHSVDQAVAAYRKALHELAPASPETAPSSFTQQFYDSMAREQLLSVLSGFFAGTALLLSGIGIYGLVAWNVNRRTMEIGLRMALGATRLKVFLLVTRQIAVMLLIGVLGGGVASFFVARSIRSFLFEVRAENPAVFVSAALLLAFIALMAALRPARRAITINPIEALRTE